MLSDDLHRMVAVCVILMKIHIEMIYLWPLAPLGVFHVV